MAETIIGLFKTEVVNRLGPLKSKAQVEWETLQWVDWFNKERLLEPLGYTTPAEAEEKNERALKSDKIAACKTNSTVSGKTGPVHTVADRNYVFATD